VELYRDLTAAVRAVDPDHLLIYEGTRWSTDWRIFTEVWDPNSMLQFHKYWSAPDRPSVAAFVETGRRLGLPIYMGEGGENEPDWIQSAFGLYDDLGISWNFWPWKKLQTWTSPVSVRPPDRWDDVVRYATGEGPRPSSATAQGVLDELLDRVRLDACEDRPEIVNALFHRVPIRLAPEAFGFRGEGRSHSASRIGTAIAFRPDDNVTIRPVGPAGTASAFDHWDRAERRPPRFQVWLGGGEWVAYAIEVPAEGRLDVELGIRLAHEGDPVPSVQVGSRPVPVELRAGRLCGSTSEPVAQGRHLLRVQGVGAETVIESIFVGPSDAAAGQPGHTPSMESRA